MFDLTKFLAMSEEERWDMLEGMYGKGGFHSFPTLAFRLRDEAMEKDDDENESRYMNAMVQIYCLIEGDGPEENLSVRLSTEYWYAFYAQPIHWIAAALEAMKGEGNGVSFKSS